MTKHNCPDCQCEERTRPLLFRKQQRLYPTVAEERRYRELKQRYGLG